MTRCLLVLLLLAAHARAETAVAIAIGRDGKILARKEMTLDVDGKLLRWKKREWKLDAFYLIESADGTLLWAPDYDSRMRGYELLARSRIRDEAERLLRSALRYKDANLSRRLFEVAQDNGLNGKDADKLGERIEKLEARRPPPNKKAAQVKADAGRLDSVHADLLFLRVERELPRDRMVGLRMLRDLLILAPEHATARRVLKSLAPKQFAMGGPRNWLDWELDIAQRDAKLDSDEGFSMRQARKTWRKDLHGIRTGPILIITPVRDTAILGRTLGCCRMTTDLLASLFAEYPVRRKKSDPLRIFLYENHEEYKRQSNVRGAAAAEILEFSAGHYSPEEGISRLYWLTARDAEQRIVGTAVHELTHHWLAEVNPAYNRTEGRRSSRTPGFWIVEGFARFLEEGVYDLDAGEWSLFDRRAAALDTLYSLRGSGKLIAWEKLYGGSAVTFWALNKEPKLKIQRRWRLGAQRVSEMNLWYVQASATCQFLYHAEKGKYRKALLDYVVNHYTRKSAKMSIAVAFGLTPAELGQRVEDFAKAVAEGWEPAGRRAEGR